MPPVPPVVSGPVVPAAPYRATTKDPKISAPLPFSGKSSELQNFLFGIREYVQFKVNELPDETERLAFLTAMFSGNTLDWWKGVRTSVTTNEQVLISLEEDFGDPMIHNRAYREFTTLCQGSLSILDYINKVERLNLHAGISQNMHIKVMGENINPEIALAIASSPYDYSGNQTWKNTVIRIGT